MAARKTAVPSGPVISVRGAREHNLRNINVEIPRDKLVVFTGLSGSGKSSLAFDTIYAEGQRRYVESLSAYARQFLGQMDKPDVDVIEGLSPAISIDQKSASRNPRSTVGTITEVYDYLRLLYARIGVQHCPNDGTRLQRQTPQQIVDRILQLPEGTRFQVLAPVVRGRKGEYDTLLGDLSGQGYVRARIDGEVVIIDEFLQRDERLARYEQHKIEIVVDRLVLREGIERRLTDSLETAPAARRWRRRGRDRRQRERARHAHLQPAPGVSRVPHVVRGAGAPQLLLQLPVRSVRDVRRPGHDVRGRPRAADPRSRAVDRRRCHRALAKRPHPVLPAHARIGRRVVRHRPVVTVGEAHRQAAADRAARHVRQADGQVQEPLRAQPSVLHRVRGCHPVDQAPPRGSRERLVARAVRGVHARGAVPRLRRGAPQAVHVGDHRRRQAHRRGVRDADRRVGEVPRRARTERARQDDRRAGHQGDQRPARVPARRRARLPQPVAERRHVGRRRGAADPVGEPDRVGPGGHALRARRAVDRSPPARQPAPDRHPRRGCATSATR